MLSRDLEWSNRADAYALADRIAGYWHAKGFHGIIVEPYSITVKGRPWWGVRTNMINGLPPRESRFMPGSFK